MSREVFYTHEDIRQISGGDDGFCFKGPEVLDPLGPLFADIQSGRLLDQGAGERVLPEIIQDTQILANSEVGNFPQGVEVKL